MFTMTTGGPPLSIHKKTIQKNIQIIIHSNNQRIGVDQNYVLFDVTNKLGMFHINAENNWWGEYHDGKEYHNNRFNWSVKRSHCADWISYVDKLYQIEEAST